jgi:hypothetical protein
VVGREQNCVIGAFLTFSSVLVQKGFPRGAITGFFSVAEFVSKAGSLGKGFVPVVTSAVHDRMPVIVDPDSYDVWLDPGVTNVAAESDLLKPYDARRCAAIP